MGVCSLALAIVAAVLIFTANASLILFSIRGKGDRQHARWDEESEDSPFMGGTRRPEPLLDARVCGQAYAMLPISVVAVISLALYKAENDANAQPGGLAHLSDQIIPSVAFLQFMDCGNVFQSTNTTDIKEHLAVHLHTEFMESVMYATAAWLVIFAIRAIFADVLPDGEGASCVQHCFNAMRLAHSLSVVLLIFAMVGFVPLLLSGIACGISVTASLATLAVLDCSIGSAEGATDLAAKFARRHAFGFFNVSLPSLYCFGCLLLESMVMETRENEAAIHLHYIGLQWAIFAVVWFLLVVYAAPFIRACFNNSAAFGRRSSATSPSSAGRRGY